GTGVSNRPARLPFVMSWKDIPQGSLSLASMTPPAACAQRAITVPYLPPPGPENIFKWMHQNTLPTYNDASLGMAWKVANHLCFGFRTDNLTRRSAIAFDDLPGAPPVTVTPGAD